VSVTIRPSHPRRPSHSSHTGHNGSDLKLLSSSEFAAAAEEEEIAVGVNDMPVDGFDLRPGVTSDEFSLYIAVYADVQTVAEVN